MTKGKRTVFFIARTGVVAGMYAALTILLAPISYGAVQCRVSEAMTLFPMFFPEAVPGLIIGCLISNIYTGWWVDMVFGTLATALAATATFLIGKFLRGKKILPFIGGIPPVLINAIILPLMWLLFASDEAYWVNFAVILIGQTAAVYAIGVPLYYGLKKARIAEWGLNPIKKSRPNADNLPKE